MQVTMSNHKSTESALKNHEIQVGQLAKQLAEKYPTALGQILRRIAKKSVKLL